MANIEALEETLAYIEAHPEQHDQSVYGYKNSCETTACFAGWHLLLTNQAEYQEDTPGNFRLRTSDDHHGSCFYAALESLDLTYGQANQLFLASQDIVDVRETVDMIKNGETFSEYEDEDYDGDFWADYGDES